MENGTPYVAKEIHGRCLFYRFVVMHAQSILT